MKQITLLFSLLLFVFSTNAQDCLPTSSPWTGVDIGDVALTGTSCYDSSQNSFEVTASGADIWGTSDEFHYVYQELAGDGEIVARIDGLTNTHPWAKAGVMMRNSTDADAAQILMSLSTNPINMGISYSLQDRPSKGATMRDNLNNIGPVPVGSFPYYVRLVREGNNFTGYASATNGGWTLVGTKTIDMNETILVGLATTSHRDGTATMAKYSEVEVEAADSKDPAAFITTWKTDNPGGSNDNQITIPTFSGETYNYTVDWGDGSSDSNVSSTITHSYATPGTYQISISGTYPAIAAGISRDNKKLLSVDQWGSNVWKNMGAAFSGCENVQILATDAPDLSNVTNMEFMFAGAYSMNNDIGHWDTSTITNMTSTFSNARSFNQDISSWDTSNVTSFFVMFDNALAFNQDIGRWDTAKAVTMQYMFSNAKSFDQNLGTWDITNLSSMENMFQEAGLSVENYDRTLQGWSTQQRQNGILFNAGSSQYCEAEQARQKLIDDFGWTITDGGKSADCEEPQRPFITTWKTDNQGTSANNQIRIPTAQDEVYNYSIDWGDGSSDSGVTGDITHTYSTPGTYSISITGEFPRIYLVNGSGENNKIISVEQWGDIKWHSMKNAFQYCHNMDVNAQDTPDLSLVTNMQGMFANSDSLIGNSSFGLWDVSNVTDMSYLFSYAENFNQDIGSWDVGNVTEMGGMFSGLKTFNQDIGAWNVGKVETMINMFADAEAFNQDIGDWDLSSARSLSQMFLRASSFNQDVGNWNLSNVERISGMFYLATAFNQDISEWDVGNVEDMRSLFNQATAFDQNLGAWNISNVSDMEEMFAGAGLSSENYDALLTGWSNLPNVQAFTAFDAGSSQYCDGAAGRRKLVDDFGWRISDGGLLDGCDGSGSCTTVSSPWIGTDIGDVALAGTSCYNAIQDTFEVTASGADIWGTQDEFHYVYQELTGDGEIIAKVEGLTNTHPWAKAGVMMRNSADSDAAQILMSLSTNPVNVGIGYSLQDRPSKGAAMRGDTNNIGPVPVGSFPYYVRLVREGNNFTGYASPTNGNWTLVGTKPITMNETILVGLATTSHNDGTLTTANYAEVSIKRGADPVENNPPKIFLVGDKNIFLFNGEPYIELGATAMDIEDGDISDAIRINGNVDSTQEGTYLVSYDVSDSEGATATEIRFVTVGVPPDSAPPVITLIGPNSVTLTVGEAYTELGATAVDDVDGDITQNLVIDNSRVNTNDPGTYLVTYDVTDEAGNNAIQTARTVIVIPDDICLHLPWRNIDIGDVAVNGTACYGTPGNSFEVTASGADIWGTNDEFHFVYQRLSGDGEIIARVDGLTNTHPWAKAGVMMRNSVDSDAAQILMSLSTNPVNVGIGYSLQDRPSKGAAMNGNANNIGPVPVGSFPYYVRLVRQGNNFTGYASASNGNWTLVGTKTIAMESTILVGLATTSHRDGTITTANYAEVEIQGTTSADSKGNKALAEGNTENQSQNIANTVVLDQNSVEMRTYPNPSSDFINVSFGTISTISEFQIYDVTGRLVRTQKASPVKNGNEYRLDVMTLDMGSYFLRAKDRTGRVYENQLLIKR